MGRGVVANRFRSRNAARYYNRLLTMLRTPARIGFLLVAAAVVPHGRAATQQSPSNEPPNTVTVSVNSVVVRDAHYRAFGELTQSDIRLFDNASPLVALPPP